MLRLYNTALLPLRLGVELWGAWSSRDRARREEWAERRSRQIPNVRPGSVWIHGASVGEARIVRAIANRLRETRVDLPRVMSATTVAGRAQLPGAPDVDAAFFAPLDFPSFVARTIARLRPAALALVETELWPNLLHEAHVAGLPVAVINARLSPARMKRYRYLRRLYRPLVERLSLVGAQSEEDAARFRELGVPASIVTVTGNIKYDLPVASSNPDSLRHDLGLPTDRPVLVAGSTAPGEERLVLTAFARLRTGRGDLLLVLAPRHVERAGEVAQLVASEKLNAVRYSRRPRVDPDTHVLVLDTVGDLPGFYRLARVAFVGGSLVPVGGHNVLEPAGAGVPVLFGPHTEHFSEPAEALQRSGGGRRVRDAGELAEIAEMLLDDADEHKRWARCATDVVDANRGAVERSVSLLLSMLDTPTPRTGAGAA